MKNTNAYNQIVMWQKAHNICIGDQITFLHKGRKRSGFLTGFDLEHHPLKLIVRYINRFGFIQIITIDKDAVTSRCDVLQVV